VRTELRPYLLLILITVLIDQLSKIFIITAFLPGETKQVLGDFIRFTFVFNPGGAFGITLGGYWLYTIFSLVAIIVVVIYFLKASRRPEFIKICLALVIGGALGNMIDRVLYRKVIDFIDIDIFDIMIPPFSFLSLNFSGLELHRWYTFNVADAAITISLIGILIFSIFSKQEKDTVVDSARETP